MTYLKWDPRYSVGTQAIDDEHREMIESINSLHDELGDTSDPASLDRFMGDIHAGISMHFALEERLMRESRYAEYDAHKRDHEELLDQIRDMMDNVIDDREHALATLEERLSKWFGEHFATFDARLHRKLGPHDHVPR